MRLKKNSKVMYNSHGKGSQPTLKYKVSMNKDTGGFSYEATGSIDQDVETMTTDGRNYRNELILLLIPVKIAFHKHITTN